MSAFYLGDKAVHRSEAITSISGISRRHFPFTYSGVPIFSGRAESIYLSFWLIKFVVFWKAGKPKFSRSGVTKICHLTPVYTMSCALVPKSVLIRVERLMAKFLWNNRVEVRTHWVNSNSICLPFEEEGLGIRRLAQIQDCLDAKLLWLVMKGGTLWANFPQSKIL